MEIKKIDYLNHSKAYELKINNDKMIIVADYGPRIIFFGNDKTGNVLFFDEKKKLGVNDWHLYGGHRLWIGPETDHTYNSDNEPCDVIIENSTIKVSTFDPQTKLEKSMFIFEAEKRFNIKHSIVNKGNLLYQGAIWALTVVNPKGTVFMPVNSKGGWQLNKIVYWKKWGSQTTNISSKQYEQTNDLFLIKPTGETGKVGAAGHEGFIGITDKNFTFLIKFDRLPIDSYPDDNCAIECYTCKDFIELETLSPNMIFMPDVPVVHTEQWIIADKFINPKDGNKIRNLL
jgi:hypothetical protein